MAKSVKSLVSDIQCCGCQACVDICPKSALVKSYDENGFTIVSLNDSLCVDCGLCTEVCPVFNVDVAPSEPQHVSIAVASKEERLKSASGGAFQVIASYILRNGGKVWGAAFDDQNKLKHICIDKLVDLSYLLRSKYLQSDTAGVFKKIHSDLKNGVLTLFSGTPCQCSALRHFLGRDYENLYVIDIICHGVPSQSFFDKYLEWESHRLDGEILSYDFRYKSPGKDAHRFRIRYTNGNKVKTKFGLHFESPYYFGFQKYICLRDSCYSCPYSTPKRVGDITLGDAWGVSDTYKLSEQDGISAIMINTERGKKLYNRILTNFEFISDYSYSCLKHTNNNLTRPTKLKPERKLFLKDLQTEPFDVVVKKYLRPKRYWVFKVYYLMPFCVRNLIKKVIKTPNYE